MAKLPKPRDGVPLEIKGGRVPFSLWPAYKTTRRYGLQPRVFTSDPWPLLRRSVESRCPKPARPAAHAFLEQSEDYFGAAAYGFQSAKPVLLYYCFLNLVKTYLLTVGAYPSLDQAKHGLSEKLDPGKKELVDAYLNAFPVSAKDLNIFDAFLKAVAGPTASVQPRYELEVLLPQIVLGHRLWTGAAMQRERFVRLPEIEFAWNETSKELWLKVFVYKEIFPRLGLSRNELLSGAKLSQSFRPVRFDQPPNGNDVVCFEQKKATAYSGRPSDKLPDLVSELKCRLWTTVTNALPYRRYYVYVCPLGERAHVLPQLLATYAIMYYLGSITRYRPHHFDSIMRGEYGPFIASVLNDQPMQFVYLMASEFAQQEVTKAAII